MNISKGVVQTAKKVVIYGPEGIGKSTFASKFPGAVFIDTEGSTSHMDVARVDGVKAWHDIEDAVNYFIDHPEEIGTLVIDTMDWAERLGAEELCRERGWVSIEDPGFGKGYVQLKEKVQKLLDKLQLLVNKGVNVVMTAHAAIRKFEQPDAMGAYDRWNLKLNEKNVAPLVKEWSDMLLFANFKTDVVKTKDGTMKGTGGQKRIMYTEHTASFDAKNRYGLAPEVPFSYDEIATLFTATKEVNIAPNVAEEPKKPETKVTVSDTLPDPAKKPKKISGSKEPERPEEMKSDDHDMDMSLLALWQNMCIAKIYDTNALRKVVADRGYYDASVPINQYAQDFIEKVLCKAWNQVLPLVQTVVDDLPF